MLLARTFILGLALAFAVITADSALAKSKKTAIGADGSVIHVIKLKPIDVPVFRDDILSHYIQLNIEIEALDEAARTKIYQRLPIIRDALNSDVNQRSIMYKDAAKGIDFRRLKRRFRARLQKIVDPSLIVGLTVTAG